MVTKRTLKLIKSLQLKKYRKKYHLFLAEGSKIVSELLESDYKIQTLVATQVFFDSWQDSEKIRNVPEVYLTDDKTLSTASHFQSNSTVLAVVSMPDDIGLPLPIPADAYVLALNDIKDPGNLGTIIRIADWYGIQHIVCSPETTDLYNPKVISASMGSFLRVKLHYTELVPFLEQADTEVYAAFVKKGTDVHFTPFGASGILLMGSESHGIAPALEKYVTHKINVPRYGGAESLNVSVSTGIICDNLLRIIKL